MTNKTIDPIQRAFDADDWKQARKLIRAELEKDPTHHWLLTRLATTYYEEKDYAKALAISEKAMRSNPRCPLVLWDYACALDMLGRSDDAIVVWDKLLRRGV